MRLRIAIAMLASLAGCQGGVVNAGDPGGSVGAALAGGGPIVGLAGKCLDDSGDGTDDGNKIQLWDCNGTDAQNWTYSNGQLVGPGGKCLDVQWDNQADGTPVQLYTCNGTEAQQWTMNGGAIVSAGGYCLDVTGAGTDNGTQIELWGCHGGANQTWSMSSGGGGGGGPGRFRVAGGRIYDPDGNEFVARGINLYSEQTSAVLAAGSGAPLLSYFPALDMVRVNCFDYASDTPESLQSFVSQLTARKIVVEIEYHQYPNLDTSQAHADWYANMARAFSGNPYVWFGTENEPGADNGYSAISDEHAAVYDAVRGAGNDTIVMIDPVGGFDASNLIASTYSNMTNVVWDTHFYGWVANYDPDPSHVQSALAGQIQNNQNIQSGDGLMPVVIGEFGNSTDGSSLDANGDQVIAAVGGSGRGFLAWGWDPGGDSEQDQLVDDAGNLTAYGRQIAALMSR